MFSRHLTAGCLAAAGLVAATAAHAIELQPGNWQSVETGTENGKPVPAQTETSCLTPEEAKNPEKGLAVDKETRNMCKTYDVQRSASGLTFRMQCAQGKDFAMDITADFTFVSATQYSGTLKSSVKAAGQTMTSDKKIEAKRVGECKK